jgi:branched-subunit amino acid transport protein
LWFFCLKENAANLPQIKSTFLHFVTNSLLTNCPAVILFQQENDANLLQLNHGHALPNMLFTNYPAVQWYVA